MTHIEAITKHYFKELGVRLPQMSDKTWPRFARDLLTHREIGVINARECPEIRAVAELYGRWENGAKPSKQEFDSAGSAVIYDAILATHNARQSGAAVATETLASSAYDPQRVGVALNQAATALEKGSWCRTELEAGLRRQVDHLRRLEQTNPKEMDF